MAHNSLSVSQLNEYIKGVFEDELILHDISLFGEIYEFSVSGSNTYVTLRENNSIIQCLHFGTMENLAVGAKVRLFGSVNYFTKGGRISFIFKTITLTGEGELFAEFLKLKARLKEEGLFDNQLLLPRLISKIAIVTSETGAVIHDFLSAVHRYDKFANVDIFPSRVQGLTAVEDVCAALKLINSLGAYDVIVVARGGGSDSDLEAFNCEPIARAVASSKIPVISAVGHETDYTLCDYCASRRAGTPSIAGEIIANINAGIFAEFRTLTSRLGDNIDRHLLLKQRRLKNAALIVAQNADMKIALAAKDLRYESLRLMASGDNLIELRKDKVSDLTAQCLKLIDFAVGDKQLQLSGLESALDKNSPLRILSKGYAKVFLGGRAVKSLNDVNDGDSIEVYVSDGRISAKVTDKKNLTFKTLCDPKENSGNGI